MSLCKLLTVSPVPIAADCRNAQKPTGPRLGQGKVQSCIIGLRDGGRSLLNRDLMQAIFAASTSAADEAGQAPVTRSPRKTPTKATISMKNMALSGNSRGLGESFMLLS